MGTVTRLRALLPAIRQLRHSNGIATQNKPLAAATLTRETIFLGKLHCRPRCGPGTHLVIGPPVP
jgi:hypothetical protein